MQKKRITVLLADDTVIAIEGWKAILSIDDTIDIIAAASTTLEAVRLALQLNPDVVLMDLMWTGDPTAGTSAIREIKRKNPAIKIIAITAYETLIPDARRAGADSALPKTFTREQLLSHITELAARDTAVPPVDWPLEPLRDLTPRQLDVLRLLARGYGDKQIAEELVIAHNTARGYVRAVLTKLGVKNRAQAAALAVQCGLAGPEPALDW